MKTRLYTRKRALISSVAMLLVAMIALGTATFAWFTSNPNATATGLQLKATAAKGLVIQTESRNAVQPTFWGHDDFLNLNATKNGSKTDPIALSATSFDLTDDALGTATKVDASDDALYNAGAGNEVTLANAGSYADTANKDYYQEKVFCKLNGTGDTSDIKMNGLTIAIAQNATDQKLLNTIRVAVEYFDKSKNTTVLKGVYSLNGNVDAHGYLTGYTAGKPNYFASKPSTVGADKTENVDYYLVNVTADNDNFLKSKKLPDGSTTADNNGFSEVTLGQVDKSGQDYVRLTVYLDGQHNDCTTNNIGNAATLVKSIELNLTVAD